MFKDTRLSLIGSIAIGCLLISVDSYAQVIIQNSLPTGATIHGSDVTDNGGEWPWDSFDTFNGIKIHSGWVIGDQDIGQHYLLGLNYQVQENDTLTTHLQKPSYCTVEGTQFQLNVNGSWSHRIHWGSSPIFSPSNQAAVDRTPDSMTWEWRKLTVALSDFGVQPGETINGIAFTRRGCTIEYSDTRIGGNSGKTFFPLQFQSAKQISNWGTAYASRAIDGNTNGNFFSGSVTHTNHTGGNWWQGDLGESKAISAIKIYPRTDCCQDRLQKFDVYILDNDLGVEGQYINISQVRDQAKARLTRILQVPNGGMTWELNEPVNGRYVVIHKFGNDYLSLAEVEAHSSDPSYSYGYGVGRTAAEMCGGTDLKECLIGDAFLPISARTLHNTAHYPSWKNFFTGPEFYPDFKCRDQQGQLVDCNNPDGTVNENLLIDTINHDDAHDWDPDEHYAVVNCNNMDCDPNELYIRGPYHHHWLLNFDTAWLYQGNDYCADYATESKHWNLWKAGSCAVGHAAVVPFRKQDLEDVWPLVLMDATSSEGTHPEPFIVFSCLRDQNLDGMRSAASNGTPAPALGPYSCHTDKDSMTAIAKQFSTFGERFSNLESEAVFAIGQAIEIEITSAGLGWLLKSAAAIAELSEGAQAAARAIGSWSVHTGLDGYFLVSGIMEMAECSDAACREVALVQVGLALLSMKKAAFESPEILNNMKTILQESSNPALADEIEPFLNGVERGFEDASGQQIGTGPDAIPEESEAVTPTPEPRESEAVGVCPFP